MKLRPVLTQWFELLIARDDLTAAIEALATTQTVQLDVYAKTTNEISWTDLSAHLVDFNRLSKRFHRYWPTQSSLSATPPGGDPTSIMDKALQYLQAWKQEAEPVIERLEALYGEQTELALTQQMLTNFPHQDLDISLMTRPGPVLALRLYVVPLRSPSMDLPSLMLGTWIYTGNHDFLLLLSPVAEIDTMDRKLSALKARRLPLPTWLHGSLSDARWQLNDRISSNDVSIAELRQTLQQIQQRHSLTKALGDIAQLEWFLTHVNSLPVDEYFAWVTGWTRDTDGKALNKSLHRAKIRGLLRILPPPQDKTPPVVVENPWWIKPFEIFARQLGTPDRNEADPSKLLALIVPLLFGYMFGDVGQGGVLLLAGTLLCRRWSQLWLLIPCGLSSVLFGFMFGSVFGLEDVIDPLWLHPISEPITLLMVPLVAGMGILLLGLVLNGIESYWRGELSRWWLTDAAKLMVYIGLMISWLHPAAMGLAAVAVLWFIIGKLYLHDKPYLVTVFSALSEIIEFMLRLLINTLSFVRVGAFALAHAGLSLAVVGLGEITQHSFITAAIMLLGNIIVIILEGIVVSIQMTRLVLFEFFIRFLSGKGRIFRPLPVPSAMLHIESTEKQGSIT